MTTDAEKKRIYRANARANREKRLAASLTAQLKPDEIRQKTEKRVAEANERRLRFEVWSNNPHDYVTSSPSGWQGARCTCGRKRSHRYHTVKIDS